MRTILFTTAEGRESDKHTGNLEAMFHNAPAPRFPILFDALKLFKTLIDRTSG